jgi:hypothetical protein
LKFGLTYRVNTDFVFKIGSIGEFVGKNI